jgi:hypothetical protein
MKKQINMSSPNLGQRHFAREDLCFLAKFPVWLVNMAKPHQQSKPKERLLEHHCWISPPLVGVKLFILATPRCHQ